MDGREAARDLKQKVLENEKLQKKVEVSVTVESNNRSSDIYQLPAKTLFRSSLLISGHTLMTDQ